MSYVWKAMISANVNACLIDKDATAEAEVVVLKPKSEGKKSVKPEAAIIKDIGIFSNKGEPKVEAKEKPPRIHV